MSNRSDDKKTGGGSQSGSAENKSQGDRRVADSVARTLNKDFPGERK